ncbi:unnamed protein product [Choristocarpus tenellus]
MLLPEEAEDEEIKKEIIEEMGTCGKVEQFHVHQQRASSGAVESVFVFVVYSAGSEAAAAMQKMHGRFFAGREVQAKPYDYDLFCSGVYET